MKISIVGTGYVGLVSGSCFAKIGHDVICVDVDEEKVKKINNQQTPIYEEGLEEILKEYKENIQATDNYSFAIENSEITFICVGTPSKENGEIDLKYVKQAAEKISEQIKTKKSYHVVVVKSTVIPGTTRNIIRPFLEEKTCKKAGVDFGLGMNPEFLREGVAVEDFLNPDRVVNGSYDKKTKNVLKELYKDFSCPIVETSLTAAEMIKYASNCFLATKISFINEIGNYCKNLGIDAYDVADGIGLDKRINRSFLNAGIGWGGSCFPKDTKALRAWAKQEQISSKIIDSTIAVNESQPLQMIKLLKKHFQSLEGKKIAVLGLAFKPNTDDIRDTRTLPIVEKLIKERAKVKAYDPKATENFRKIRPDIEYCETAIDAIEDVDAILITTLWDEFKELDYSEKVVIDGRRMAEAKKAKVYDGVCW